MLTEPISKPTFSAAVSLKGLIVDLFFSLGTNGFMTSQSWERHSRLRWLHLNLFFYGSVWYFTSFSSIIYENAFSKREDRTPCLSSLAMSFSRPFSGTWPQCFPANFVCAVCSRHFGALPPLPVPIDTLRGSVPLAKPKSELLLNTVITKRT